MAVLHTPRMAALIPGQSPPDVRIPILITRQTLNHESFIIIYAVKIEKKINKLLLRFQTSYITGI
jgi:hypothetical protein